MAKDRDESPISWRSFFEAASPTLAVSGLLVYAIVGLMYDQLYAHFDVTPSDVGLGYGTVLSSAIGIVLATIVLIIAAGGLAYALFRARPTFTASGPFLPVVLAAFVAITGMTSFLLGYADGIPSKIEHLCSVPPMRVGPVVVIRVRVYDAAIQSIAKKGEAPAIEALEQNELLYLGQANGNAVVYDREAREPIYVPTSSVAIHIKPNC